MMFYTMVGSMLHKPSGYSSRAFASRRSKHLLKLNPKLSRGGKASAKSESTEKYLKVLRAKPAKEGSHMTTAEKEISFEIVKDYTRQKMLEHNHEAFLVNRRQVLHLSAIEQLPTEAMKSAAMKPDMRLFPLYRQVPTWTPPRRKQF